VQSSFKEKYKHHMAGLHALQIIVVCENRMSRECNHHFQLPECMPGVGEPETSTEQEQELEKHWEHVAAALHALQTILEAQPRLSAIMASTAALAPICNCIEPICRHGPHILSSINSVSVHIQ
jgi:hypothetical protein